MKAEEVRGQKLYRSLTLDLRAIDEEKRTVPASLSSEIAVKRFFGNEVLEHTARAINLERTTDGLPMLFGHDQDQPIGLVEDVRLDGDKLRGLLRFSKNRRASEVWDDVREGFLRNISIGYRIDKFEEEDDSNTIRATKWTPFEASVVSVPADHSVGINRAKEDQTMPTKTETTEGSQPELQLRGDDKSPVNVVELKAVREQALREGEERANKGFAERTGKIHELFSPFLQRGPTFVTLRDQLVLKGATVEQSRDALYQLFAGEPEPVMDDLIQHPDSANGEQEQVRTVRTEQGRRHEVIKGGTDYIEKFRDGATEALMHRVGTLKDEKATAEIRQNEFLSMSPVEMAREYLRTVGVNVRGMNRDRIVAAALTTRGLISHSTSDFANLLEDVANKSLLMGYEEAPETWQAWCRVGSLPDFRQGNRPNISAFGDLDVVYEDGEYKYGSFSDLKEVLTLLTYGKLFSISRQALVNDDLNALGRIPAGMGRAAARKVGDLAYNVLINGITVVLNQDAKALFHADHGNFVAAGSGAVPSVATINAARTAMATQTDPSGAAILNIRPSILIVPAALESTGRAIQMAEKDPAIASGEMPNTVRGTFETVSDARLDADDAAKWYMSASPTMFDTVEVAFLDGQQTPFMESQNGWSTDGVSYKVRIDATAAPMDFRGLYHNDGN
jgi:HK97 family phage prohead protease